MVGGARFCTACGAPPPRDPDDAEGGDGGEGVVAPVVSPAPTGRPCRGCDLDVSPAWACCPRCGAADPAATRDPDATRIGRAPGWHPDPFRPGRSRWWDGRLWSPYVSDGEVGWEPLSFAAPREPALPGLGVALVGFVVGVAIGFPVSFLLHELDEPGGRTVLLVVSALTLWLGIGGALLYVSVRRGTGSLANDYGLRFRLVDLPLGVAGWIAARLFGGVLVLPIVAVWPDLEPPDEGIYGDDPISAGMWVALVVIVCIGAPLIEELFFRGFVQPRLVERYGTVAGIALASVLFGAAHLIGWVGPITFVFAAAITGAGVVLGVLRHVTGRLGAPIAAHACFNVQALVVLAVVQ